MAFDLLLVRHGLTEWNEQGRLIGRTDIPLNQRGEGQATAVGQALRPLAPGRLLASPQLRTQQTAQAISSACQIDLETDADLDEVWLGRWQGKTYGELADDADAPRYLSDPAYVCDAVEPLSSLHRRLTAFAERLRHHRGAPVVAVSHGDPLRILLAILIELPVAHFRRLLVQPGSISVVRVGHKQAQLRLLGYSPSALGEALRR